MLRVGTAGWSFRHWRRRFYPEALLEPDWLAFYAREFALVEVERSFHELPSATEIRRWVESTPSMFEFSLRAPRQITHERKLKGCQRDLLAFCARLDAFGDRLGPSVFQLPPRWRCNLRRLAAFLPTLPRGRRFAFEFRDPSWHADEVYELLAEHQCAFCEFEGPGFASPLRGLGEGGADFAYLRLRGPVGAATPGNYRAQRLRSWVGQTRTWDRFGKDAYVVFDNDEAAFGPRNAQRFLHFARGDTN